MVYRRRGSRRYWITVPTRMPGHYVHLSTGTKDEPTARAMAAMWQLLGASGRRQWDLIDAVIEKRCTVARLYDAYVTGTLDALRAELADIDLAPHVEAWRRTITQRHRGESVRKYPKWVEALCPLDDAGHVKRAMRSRLTNAAHLSSVLANLSGSNTNRRRHHEAFTALFDYLVTVRLVVERNPMAEVPKALKVKAEQPHIARVADALRLVHALPSAEERAMHALAEGGGLELQAIYAMRPIDVVNAAERIVFAHGSKNVYRDRQAVIDAEFWAVVVGYLGVAGVHPAAPLFRIPEDTYREHFREACRALRSQHVPIPERYAPHKARHTYTIRHLQAGDDPTLIAENLGHSDVSTLFRDYGRYRPKATEIRRAKREAHEASSAPVSAPVEPQRRGNA